MQLVIFNFSNYKEYLSELFKAPQNRGLMTKAAETIGCGKSYLSRVLSEKMDLSLDQGFQLSQFLDHTENETEYFKLCIEFSRAQNFSYKKNLQNKIKNSMEKFLESQKQGENPKEEFVGSEIEYYLNWYLIPLHLMSSFEGGISLKEACAKLNLSENIISTGLDYLLNLNLVSKKNLRFYYNDGAKYLPKNHPFLLILNKNLKDQSILQSQYKNSNSLNFSIWQSLSSKDYETVRMLLHSTIDKINKISQPSKSEKVIGLSIDLFDPFK